MKSASLKYCLIFGLGLLTMLGIQSVRSHFAFCHQEFDLLSPSRRCINTFPQGEWNYEYLREVLSARKDELKASGALSHLSIYFQDLDHGPRFGIGEYDKFQPASLLKLPLAIFFLHAADLDPDILESKLSFTGTLKIEDNLETPEESILPGTQYSIRDLVTKMIVYSDNRSYVVLLREMNRLSQSVAYFTFRDLDVLQLMLESENTYVSISSYAKLFGVLYNTGYLSKEMSQFMLQLLSDATFREGIVAGVPEGQRVAHKFGYGVVEGEDQLHDCGIVYHPKMAYILCVMTSGKDPQKSNDAIIEISKTVYDSVSKLDFDHLQGVPIVP